MIAILGNNDCVRFLKEFRTICNKYVKNSSILQMEFKDGSTIGIKTLLEVGLNVKQIEDIYGNN